MTFMESAFQYGLDEDILVVLSEAPHFADGFSEDARSPFEGSLYGR